MKTATFRRKFAEVRKARRAGDFAMALEKLDRLIEHWPANPSLHVLRSDLIQLQDESGLPLDAARNSLDEALALDAEYPEALVELAHYQLAIEDDAQAANKTFEKAAQVCTRLLIESLLGRAASLVELDQRQAAFDCLAKARLLQARGSNGKAQSNHATQRLMETWDELTGVGEST